MRAMSAFSLLAGTSTLAWRAPRAFRIRVSMSAIGSDVILASPFLLPTRLDHARDLPGEGQLAKTNPAKTKLAQVSPRPPAAVTAVPVPAAQLDLAGLLGLQQFPVLGNLGGCGHASLSLSVPHCRNGIPRCLSSASPSASDLAVVVIQTFMPLVFST